MNVFVLCTGRSGSSTFVAACKHIRNYSSGHETRSRLFGPERFAYADQHIEADNRLSWLLGRLDHAYGDQAFYVHLKRDPLATAESFQKRWNSGIIDAYRRKIIMGTGKGIPLEVCLDYCETVNQNIELFLKDKTRVLSVQVENWQEDFVGFWNEIGAEGDLDAAVSELGIRHNASSKSQPWWMPSFLTNERRAA